MVQVKKQGMGENLLLPVRSILYPDGTGMAPGARGFRGGAF